MQKIFFTISILMAMLFPSVGFTFMGPPGCGQDCVSCHTLTKEEASKLLKMEVDNVSQASAKGLWEVTGKQKGKTVKVHMDYGKKYAIVIQAFIPIENIGKPPEMKKVDVKSIPLTDSLIVGDPDAKNKLIVFSDPDCPYCRKLHTEMKDIVKKRKDISFYVKLFPLVKLHPQSYEKSKAVQCKNSLKLLDDAFEGKDVPKVECETKVLDENIKLAEKLGISGTPAIILPDGRVVPGYMDAQNLLKLMETPQ
ncbi:MAG TPA: DsbC family protein [Nitrospirota bacterium]|nr:DsbC family protein [Nitrospirota bacterium]